MPTPHTVEGGITVDPRSTHRRLSSYPEYTERDAPSACGEWAVVAGLAAAAVAVTAFIGKRVLGMWT